MTIFFSLDLGREETSSFLLTTLSSRYCLLYLINPSFFLHSFFLFFVQVESVDLALKILDKSQIRGKTLSVQRAKFQMKGDAYDPALKPKRKKKDKERQKKLQDK